MAPRPAPQDEPTPDGEAEAPGRRHAAGEDPRKRDQILQGARQVFLEQGYDAASMNDICRAAGVSKGTLYVYFASKEELFISLIAKERERLFLDADQFLEGDRPLEEKLRVYARRLTEAICSDDVIRAQRIVAATAERMPELGARFYERGAGRARDGLRRLFEREIAAGRLSIPDPGLAAHQFMELASAGLWRQRLFGKAPTPPAPEAVEATADSAVAMFLAAYAAR
jgi:AcrR family transcriptional regulator